MMSSCGKLTFALVALCLASGIQADSVPTGDCPNVVGKGTFLDLTIAGCPAGEDDACILPANVFHDFTLMFSPSNTTIERWLRLTVTGRAYKGNSEIQTIGFRQLEGEIFTLVPGLMRFPRLGSDIDDFDLRFLLESSNGVEVCRTYVMKVLEFGQVAVEGSAPGDKCPNVTPGEPCGFRNSQCVVQNSEKICMCDRQSEEQGGTCRRRTSWRCSSDHECVENAQCDIFGTDRACRCASGFFGNSNSICVVNGGSTVDSDCVHPSVPCGFPHSMCNSDRKCGCSSDAAVDSASKTCRLLPEKGGCSSDAECIPNAACIPLSSGEKKCVCKPGYAVESNGCVAYNNGATSVGASCQKSGVSCGFDNSLCGTDNKCTCSNGFVVVGTTCALPAGNGCNSNIDCGSNAYCGRDEKGEDTCVCLGGFEPSRVGKACIKPEGVGISSTCTIRDAQCTFPNSVCSGSGNTLTCGCDSNSLNQNDQCRLKASTSCKANMDCVESANCSNGLCTCINNGTATAEGACSNADVVVFYAPLLVVALMALILNK